MDDGEGQKNGLERRSKDRSRSLYTKVGLSNGTSTNNNGRLSQSNYYIDLGYSQITFNSFQIHS